MAAELKQMLDSPLNKAEEQILKRPKKTEHVANLSSSEPAEGDTIFIDHEGNLKPTNPSA